MRLTECFITLLHDNPDRDNYFHAVVTLLQFVHDYIRKYWLFLCFNVLPECALIDGTGDTSNRIGSVLVWNCLFTKIFLFCLCTIFTNVYFLYQRLRNVPMFMKCTWQVEPFCTHSVPTFSFGLQKYVIIHSAGNISVFSTVIDLIIRF